MTNDKGTPETPRPGGRRMYDLSAPLVTSRTELARRESGGVTVTLFWSRETDSLALSVLDARGGDFELVLAPNDRPLDVFDHPYAYAALRGVDPVAPAAAVAPTAGSVCASCSEAVDHSSNLCCLVIRAEVASGLSEMRTYLEGWARFDAWDRARGAGEPAGETHQ